MKDLESHLHRMHRALPHDSPLQQLIDLLPLPLAMIDPTGCIWLHNRAFQELVASDRNNTSKLTGHAIQEQVRLTSESSLRDRWERSLRRKEPCQLSGCLEEGKRILQLHCFPVDLRDLSWSQPLHSWGERWNHAIADEDTAANTRLLWVLIQDVTQQQRMQEQLQRTERLASIGRLSANLAHELNSPLDGAMRYLQFLIADLNEDDPRWEYARAIQDGLQRMARIIKGLLYFSRQNAPQLQPIDIHATLEEVLAFFEVDLRKRNIEVVREYAPALPVLLYRDLEQVFLNLIKNALQAMPEGGTLTLRTWREQGHVPIQEVVCVQIEDTGTGIPPEIQSRVFLPFFTTKDVGEGTGLGLSICQGIVERHHGEILIDSQLNRGTTVTVKLPVESTD